MLTPEVMGLLCLAILWVNTLLVIGAAFGPLRTLLERLRWMRGLRRAEVLTAAGDDDVIASHRVEQVGRRAADDAGKAAILYHDRQHESRLYGGTLRAGEETVTLTPGDVEVWVRRAEQSAPDEPFDAAYRKAKKAQGHMRAVTADLRTGDAVYFAQPEDGPTILASFDPRPWCRARAALVVGAQLAILVVAAGVTFVALYPPVFGTVSTIGGALGLAYFLLVQPVGVSLRDAVLIRPRAWVRGSWLAPDRTSERPALATS